VVTTNVISRLFPEGLPEKGRAGDGVRRLFEVYRFPPDTASRPRLSVSLAEAADGRIWCLTSAELFRFNRRSGVFVGEII